MAKQRRRRKRTNKLKSRTKNKVSKKITLSKTIGHIKRHIIQKKPRTFGDAIAAALKSAKKYKNKIKSPRVIPIPKTGGVLPLIPIFAALSALGSIAGGTSAVVNAVGKARAAKQQLEESQRHNKTMEAIAMGKGLHLKPYKTGLGLFLRPALAVS